MRIAALILMCTVPAMAQLPPIPVSVASTQYASITLLWDPSPDDPGDYEYFVYQGTDSGNYSTVTLSPESNTMVVSNLMGGVTYFFAVTARNSYGFESDFSNEAEFAASIPNSPESLRIETVPMLSETIQGFDGTNWVNLAQQSIVITGNRPQGLFRSQLSMSNQPAITWSE